jgi:dephospho-CoA kinase
MKKIIGIVGEKWGAGKTLICEYVKENYPGCLFSAIFDGLTARH